MWHHVCDICNARFRDKVPLVRKMGMRIGGVQIIHAATDGLTSPSGSGMAAGAIPATLVLGYCKVVWGYDPGYASMQPTLSDSWNSPRNI